MDFKVDNAEILIGLLLNYCSDLRIITMLFLSNLDFFNLDLVKSLDQVLSTEDLTIEIRETIACASYHIAIAIENLPLSDQILKVKISTQFLQRSINTHLHNNAAVWNHYAFNLIVVGDFKEALSAFENAIALEPKLSIAHNGRSICLKHLGIDDETSIIEKLCSTLEKDVDPEILLHCEQ